MRQCSSGMGVVLEVQNDCGFTDYNQASPLAIRTFDALACVGQHVKMATMPLPTGETVVSKLYLI